MARIQALAATIHFMILMLAGCQDLQVTCLFSEDCLLPCSFRPSGEEVIHWKRQKVHVHSFYYGQNQLQIQDSRYIGRTSLFQDLIIQGNASLLLQRTKISDEGQYSCYTSTTLGARVVFISVQMKGDDTTEPQIPIPADNPTEIQLQGYRTGGGETEGRGELEDERRDMLESSDTI
ncbi:CD276 antigen-like [Anguilla anguilla]|uniref:CD276 antigen-like n=1 Tax=Anguilla anguilla TaxID=7936 RepID=UPI0015ADA6BA|nr:CD276 antigen-like [Anguilla anguilla]